MFGSLFKIREHGIQGIERTRRYADKPVCNSNGGNFESVRITDCYAPFWILCYGMIASIVILLIEFLYQSK